MEARAWAQLAADAAIDKKAEDVVILDLEGLTVVADYFVIASGRSPIQVRSITDHIREEMAKAGRKPRGVEGYAGGRWVLLDYGDVIVHIFEADERDYYGLERLWGDAERIGADPVPAAPAKPQGT